MTDIAAVGAIAIRDGCLLIIRRGHEPGLGLWSLPGGRVEAGETDVQALVREMAEETGLAVRVGAFVGEVVRPGLGDVSYLIRDYAVEIVGGTPSAGDDAAELAWVPFDQLPALPLTVGLLETLRGWAVIP